MNAQGFTLLEALLSMAIGSVMLIGAARMLPLLQQQNLQLQVQVQLNEELQQIMQTLEKAIRRAGYCHGRCGGEGLQINGATGHCLLIRWDENGNGKWEGAGREDSDYYGFRLRGKNIEMQRGVDRCDGGGWEKLNDPRVIVIDNVEIARSQRQVRIRMTGRSSAWPSISRRIEHWVIAENL